MGRHTVQKWVEGKTVRGVDWNANRRVDGVYWENIQKYKSIYYSRWKWLHTF